MLYCCCFENRPIHSVYSKSKNNNSLCLNNVRSKGINITIFGFSYYMPPRNQTRSIHIRHLNMILSNFNQPSVNRKYHDKYVQETVCDSYDLMRMPDRLENCDRERQVQYRWRQVWPRRSVENVMIIILHNNVAYNLLHYIGKGSLKKNNAFLL